MYYYEIKEGTIKEGALSDEQQRVISERLCTKRFNEVTTAWDHMLRLLGSPPTIVNHDIRHEVVCLTSKACDIFLHAYLASPSSSRKRDKLVKKAKQASGDAKSDEDEMEYPPRSHLPQPSTLIKAFAPSLVKVVDSVFGDRFEIHNQRVQTRTEAFNAFVKLYERTQQRFDFANTIQPMSSSPQSTAEAQKNSHPFDTAAVALSCLCRLLVMQDAPKDVGNSPGISLELPPRPPGFVEAMLALIENVISSQEIQHRPKSKTGIKLMQTAILANASRLFQSEIPGIEGLIPAFSSIIWRILGPGEEGRGNLVSDTKAVSAAEVHRVCNTLRKRMSSRWDGKSQGFDEATCIKCVEMANFFTSLLDRNDAVIEGGRLWGPEEKDLSPRITDYRTRKSVSSQEVVKRSLLLLLKTIHSHPEMAVVVPCIRGVVLFLHVYLNKLRNGHSVVDTELVSSLLKMLHRLAVQGVTGSTETPRMVLEISRAANVPPAFAGFSVEVVGSSPNIRKSLGIVRLPLGFREGSRDCVWRWDSSVSPRHEGENKNSITFDMRQFSSLGRTSELKILIRTVIKSEGTTGMLGAPAVISTSQAQLDPHKLQVEFPKTFAEPKPPSYVEYFLRRGGDNVDFAPSFSSPSSTTRVAATAGSGGAKTRPTLATTHPDVSACLTGIAGLVLHIPTLEKMSSGSQIVAEVICGIANNTSILINRIVGAGASVGDAADRALNASAATVKAFEILTHWILATPPSILRDALPFETTRDASIPEPHPRMRSGGIDDGDQGGGVRGRKSGSGLSKMVFKAIQEGIQCIYAREARFTRLPWSAALKEAFEKIRAAALDALRQLLNRIGVFPLPSLGPELLNTNVQEEGWGDNQRSPLRRGSASTHQEWYSQDGKNTSACLIFAFDDRCILTMQLLNKTDPESPENPMKERNEFVRIIMREASGKYAWDFKSFDHTHPLPLTASMASLSTLEGATEEGVPVPRRRKRRKATHWKMSLRMCRALHQ